MMKYLNSLFLVAILFVSSFTNSYAQTNKPTPESEATSSAVILENIIPTETPFPTPRPDFTQKSEETTGPFEKLLENQKLGSIYLNPIKYAIHGAVNSKVPPNTIILLLMIPLITTFIAAARHLVGLRGFGIFLPASLSVVFLATGPVVGLLLFLIIVSSLTLVRVGIKKTKLKLQYLPKMSLILLFVVMAVLAVLFTAPALKLPDLANVSIFPVLILVLLAEEFSKVQMGKSVNVAINLITETLLMALISYIFLTLTFVQEFVILNPELLILSLIVINILLGKFVGLRFLEYIRFRKLIKS